MKCKTTAKAIRENYGSRILSVGYCDAQALLRYESPFAYSAGTYGWNCDYYDIDGVCISTGYRPIGRDVDYAALREAEKRAREIYDNTDNTYEKRAEHVSELLRAFIKSELTRP